MADLHGTDDLQEEEVWAVMKSTRDHHQQSPNSKARKHSPGSSSSPSAWRFTAATSPVRTIPRRSNSGAGGLHLEFSEPPRQRSAPMAIPDWSKILKKKKKGTSKNLWDDERTHDDDDGDGLRESRQKVKFDDVGFNGYGIDGDEDDEMVPPHEYLARRLASTRIASFSMCEGVGRTLKGRDLSKLRNAILTKTGFLESN